MIIWENARDLEVHVLNWKRFVFPQIIWDQESTDDAEAKITKHGKSIPFVGRSVGRHFVNYCHQKEIWTTSGSQHFTILSQHSKTVHQVNNFLKSKWTDADNQAQCKPWLKRHFIIQHWYHLLLNRKSCKVFSTGAWFAGSAKWVQDMDSSLPACQENNYHRVAEQLALRELSAETSRNFYREITVSLWEHRRPHRTFSDHRE